MGGLSSGNKSTMPKRRFATVRTVSGTVAGLGFPGVSASASSKHSGVPGAGAPSQSFPREVSGRRLVLCPSTARPRE